MGGLGGRGGGSPWLRVGGGKRRRGGSLVDYHCPGTAWLAGGWREAEPSRTHYTGGLEQGPSVQVPVASPVQPVMADTAITCVSAPCGCGVPGDPRHRTATSVERDKL